MKRRTRYPLGKAQDSGIIYAAGGNPPISAGLFDHTGERVAWWPASIEPSHENIERVYLELVIKREADMAISRTQILKLLETKNE